MFVHLQQVAVKWCCVSDNNASVATQSHAMKLKAGMAQSSTEDLGNLDTALQCREDV
jgi:hypothetical protein